MRRLLAGSSFVRRLEISEAVASTNDDARRLADEGAPDATVVVADVQTAGRGRHGRVWHSAPGVGLYVSILFRPSRPLEELPRWTLAAALAACEAAREASGVEVRIKWPNDLLCGRGKVGGVLAEVRTSGGSASDLIIGTGINVNHGPRDFPEEIRGRATSLRIARGGGVVDREALLVRYLDRWEELRTALASGVWNDVSDAWRRHAPDAEGAPVRVTGRERDGSVAEFLGTTRGIDDWGALRVERGDGVVVTLRHGESVAPVED